MRCGGQGTNHNGTCGGLLDLSLLLIVYSSWVAEIDLYTHDLDLVPEISTFSQPVQCIPHLQSLMGVPVVPETWRSG